MALPRSAISLILAAVLGLFLLLPADLLLPGVLAVPISPVHVFAQAATPAPASGTALTAAPTPAAAPPTRPDNPVPAIIAILALVGFVAAGRLLRGKQK